MSRCPDYPRLLEPFVAASLDDVVAHGSVRRLATSLVGDVYECKLQGGEDAVLKAPKVNIMMYSRNNDDGSNNQRWLRQDCKNDPGFFVLYSEVFPSRVLQVYGASTDQAQLNLGEFKRGDKHQKWTLDSKGRLVSKSDAAACVSIVAKSSELGAQLKMGKLEDAARKHQRWSLQPVSGGAVLIVSALNDFVLDVAGGTDLRELYYLVRWRKEPGLVQLRHVVWGRGNTAEFIITERLGKTLGPGTGDFHESDSVLRDIDSGKVKRRTPAQAARQLLPVACFLRRIHLDGYTHNDLHDGNVLRCGKSDSSPFSVIDLGSVCEAGSWRESMGDECGEAWSVTRDWRAFALHFVSLIDGRERKMWDLVGQNGEHPKKRTEWKVPYSVNVAASVANGSESQKWLVDEEKGSIVHRGSGRALVLGGRDGIPVPQWKLKDGYIENSAKRLRLGSGSCSGTLPEGGCVRVVVQSPNGSEHQQWRYDKVSCELVNPCSRKVLDLHGEVRLPQDVRALLRGCEGDAESAEAVGPAESGVAPTESDPIFQELMEALFKARSDPNEICTLVGLLASRS
eukprot:TRINITY_DN71188_c0_g1_i1.p1 TRINITY_DN71188_c0_g1~~TRINITY_DN71188_c0_g1_i1.p1  ORF type:complete len:568 (+),score=114.33 TRINITY_DN71188_c0_g1_i1:115-1818(+)